MASSGLRFALIAVVFTGPACWISHEPYDAGNDVLDAGNDALDGDGSSEGVCCEPDPFDCGCIFLGGWAPNEAACDDARFFRSVCDAADFTVETDEHACPVLVPGPGSCLPI